MFASVRIGRGSSLTAKYLMWQSPGDKSTEPPAGKTSKEKQRPNKCSRNIHGNAARNNEVVDIENRLAVVKGEADREGVD